LDYLPFLRLGFSRCDKALPAAVLDVSLNRPSRRTLDAAVAADLLVRLFGIVTPPFLQCIWIRYNLTNSFVIEGNFKSFEEFVCGRVK